MMLKTKTWRKRHNLGNVYYERGDLERAEAQYRESLVMKQQEYSRDSKNLDLAATLQNLGNISIQRANTDDAVVKYEEAQKCSGTYSR